MALVVSVDIADQTGAAGAYVTLLKRVARRALESEALDGSYQVTLTLVSDERIRELNRLHRGIDSVTDVLSFPTLEADGASFVLPPSAPTHLGDVVLALTRASQQAEEYGHSFERELAYLAAHGMLHLLGYDHEDDEERLHMRAREEEVLLDLPR